jgi:hypothetical protein
MTRRTALELIRRMDIDRQLWAAGRIITVVDLQHVEELLRRARYEDLHPRGGRRRRCSRG